MPKLTIGIPTWNSAETIERSLNAALNQRLDDFEVLVVDDGSTDSTCKIVERWQQRNSRLVLQRNDAHEGVVFTRNRILRETVSPFLMWLDSDDWISPKQAPRCLDAIRSPGRLGSPLGFVASWFVSGPAYSGPLGRGEIFRAVTINDKKRVKTNFFPPSSCAISVAHAFGSVLSTSGALLDLTFARGIGASFNSSFEGGGEDYAFWNEILLHRNGVLLRRPVVHVAVPTIAAVQWSQSRLAKWKELDVNTAIIRASYLASRGFEMSPEMVAAHSELCSLSPSPLNGDFLELVLDWVEEFKLQNSYLQAFSSKWLEFYLLIFLQRAIYQTLPRKFAPRRVRALLAASNLTSQLALLRFAAWKIQPYML